MMVSNRNLLTSRGLVLGEILDRCFRNPIPNHRLDGATNRVNNGRYLTISTGERRISEPSTVSSDIPKKCDEWDWKIYLHVS